jgi:hypothetical protein
MVSPCYRPHNDVMARVLREDLPQPREIAEVHHGEGRIPPLGQASSAVASDIRRPRHLSQVSPSIRKSPSRDRGRGWDHPAELRHGCPVSTETDEQHSGRADDELGLEWSDWIPLRMAGANRLVASESGLYRIRATTSEVVLYIGQTGRSIRERLGSLRGVFGEQMPYSDPHTAGPGLWAIRHRDGVDFEASFAVVPGDRIERLGREALAIGAVRVATGTSPSLNFGGMPSGYRKSTGNNSRLLAAGQRRRGGPDRASPGSTATAPVAGPLRSSPTATNWLGLRWSPWDQAAAPPMARGVYRIRRPGSVDLLYVGQGQIGSRVRAHIAKGRRGTHRQAQHFADPTEVSWVDLEAMPTRQLLEVENDLIASHVLVRGVPPLAQFLG